MEVPLTAPARTPGMYGCRPALIPAGLHDLAVYSPGPLPKPPAAVPPPSIADWDPLGNMTHGDCGVAGLEHGFMAAAAATGEAEAQATADQAVAYYLAYTGGQDTGVVLSQYLAYVRENGYYGRTIDAYAPVAVRDVPSLQFAVWACDFAYTGIVVTQGMEEAFRAGEPWTLDTLESPAAGGHCIPIVGYDSSALYAVTWGKIQAIHYSAWHYMATEAWAVITGEAVAAGNDGHGLNLDALRADLSRISA